MAKRKRQKKRIRFGQVIFQAIAISIGGFSIVIGLALLSFILSPHLKVYGQPLMPLILPVLIVVLGLISVKYLVPLFVRLRCPKCRHKALRYDCNMSLSFRCDRCGIKKYTWFHIG